MAMEASLATRVGALFGILVASFIGVALPAFVHRVTTGRWPSAHTHKKPEDSSTTTEGSSTPTDEQHAMGLAPAKPDATETHPYPDNQATRATVAVEVSQPVAAPTSAPAATKNSKSGMNYMHVVKLLSALGCGAIIAIAVCHIAPESFETLEEAWGVEGEEAYPYAFGIATATIVLLYIIEKELMMQLQAREHAKQQLELEVAAKRQRAARNALEAPLDPCCAPEELLARRAEQEKIAREDAMETDECDETKLIRASIVTHVLEIGVAVHSVIIGVALGMIDDYHEARALTIALLFHQFAEGAAVGAAVMESRLGLCHTLVLWATFIFTAPIGVAIGIIVEQTRGGEDTHDQLVAQGFLEAIALGLLLYMGLVDMLPGLLKMPAVDNSDDAAHCEGHTGHHVPVSYGTVDAAHHTAAGQPQPVVVPRKKKDHGHSHGGDDDDGAPPPPAWFRALTYLMLAIGAAAMAVLAKWA